MYNREIRKQFFMNVSMEKTLTMLEFHQNQGSELLVLLALYFVQPPLARAKACSLFL